MRIRSIRPEFWSSEDISAMDWHTRLVFIGLWSYVDDNGVGRDNERLITTALFPLDDDLTESSRRVTGALRYLSGNKLITRYEVDGKRYMHISTWLKHQRIEKASKGRYPLPTSEDAAILDESGNTPGALPEPSPLGEGEKGRRGEDLSSEPDGSDAEPDRLDTKRLTTTLVEALKARGVKTPGSLKAWNTSARLLLDADKRPLDEALRVLVWSQQNTFWSTNILSMPKFREKYDALRLKMEDDDGVVETRGPDDLLRDCWKSGDPSPIFIATGWTRPPLVWPDDSEMSDDFDRDEYRRNFWRTWITDNRTAIAERLRKTS